MPIGIDEFSVKPLYLEMYRGEQNAGVATGFVVKKNDSYYLITNWHVVTCRNPYNNNRPLSTTGVVDPNILKVWFHGVNLGNWISKEIEDHFFPTMSNFSQNLLKQDQNWLYNSSHLPS